MKSQGEIEAEVCSGISQFQQEFIGGRGPKDIRAHLISSLLVVRLHRALTAAERQLVSPQPRLDDNDSQETATKKVAPQEHSRGRALLKEMRTCIVEAGRSQLEEIVQTATGVKLVSVHHDISTVTGEEVFVFSLAGTPACRAITQHRGETAKDSNDN